MMLRLLIPFILLISFANSGLFDFYKIYQAKKRYESGDFNKSLKLFKSLKIDTPIYNYNLANCYYKTKNYKMSILYYKRAFGEGVKEIDRLHNLGNAYLKLKEYNNAIVAYESALKLKDSNDTKHNLLIAKFLKKQQLKQQKKNKKSKKHKNKNVKHSKHKNKKQLARKKLTKEELKKLRELEKKEKLNKELKKFIKKSLEGKKLPVLMYRIKEGNIEKHPKNPW